MEKIVVISENNKPLDFFTALLIELCKHVGIQTMILPDRPADEEMQEFQGRIVRCGDINAIYAIVYDIFADTGDALKDKAARMTLENWLRLRISGFVTKQPETIDRLYSSAGGEIGDHLVRLTKDAMCLEMSNFHKSLEAIDRSVRDAELNERSYFFCDEELVGVFEDAYYESYNVRWQLKQLETGDYEVFPATENRRCFAIVAIHTTLDGTKIIDKDTDIEETIKEIDRKFAYVNEALSAHKVNDSYGFN